MKNRIFPVFVGWYAIVSIMDAMVYSISGLSIFVWQLEGLRVALTVADAIALLLTYGYLNWDWFCGDERKMWRYYATRVVKDEYDNAIRERIRKDRETGRGYFYHDPY